MRAIVKKNKRKKKHKKKNLPTHCFWLESHCVKGQQPKGNLEKKYFHKHW